jgi:hypothetical protein
METEHLEKRFGVIIIDKGYCSAEQFIEALKIQVMEDVTKGKHRLVGRILLEQGVVDLQQINEVLQVLGKGLPLLKESDTV